MFRRAARLPALISVAIALLLTVGVQSAQAEGPVDLQARTGLDISWPQCGAPLPGGMSYAIVGVNGGTAASTNPCLAEQLSWAETSTTGVDPNRPRIQLYVNTANPGEVLEEYGVTTWPITNLDSRGLDSSQSADEAHRNPYGLCAQTLGNYRGFTNDLACSWQYGWNRAVEAVDQRFAPAARASGVSDRAADYTWWLDVETMNSWQLADADAYARNTASIEGMKQFYVAEGAADVGLYSTNFQWDQIVGNTLSFPNPDQPTTGGNLKGLKSWMAGAQSADGAAFRCLSLVGLTGGPVAMNQYIADDLDYNYSCT